MRGLHYFAITKQLVRWVTGTRGPLWKMHPSWWLSLPVFTDRVHVQSGRVALDFAVNRCDAPGTLTMSHNVRGKPASAWSNAMTMQSIGLVWRCQLEVLWRSIGNSYRKVVSFRLDGRALPD